MTFTKIDNVHQLRHLASRNYVECFIQLRGGLRSSKYITYDNGIWFIENEVDGTHMEFTDDKELWTRSNIGEAMDKGALWMENTA